MAESRIELLAFWFWFLCLLHTLQHLTENHPAVHLIWPECTFSRFSRRIPHLHTTIPFFPLALSPSLWSVLCSRPQNWPPLSKALTVCFFLKLKHLFCLVAGAFLFTRSSSWYTASSGWQHSFLTCSLYQDFLYSESPIAPQLPLIWGWENFPPKNNWLFLS